MSASETSFYVIGGTLRPDALSYVERPADRELFERLIQGEFCYVLTSRQMGKSSLMARTARRLRERAIRAVTLDLTAVGQNLTPEQWHDGLVVNLGHQLKLEDELDEFWLNSTRLSPVHRFFSAIREVVMKRLPEPLVVFVDEIDIVRSLPFSTDEFFAAIRECFNRRSDEPSLSPLTFCLLGMATPSDLIRNARTTPFNIGHRIELTDFTLEEAAPLARGFRVEPELAEELLERMLYWTHGHPYLTQRLCRATAEANDGEQISKLRILNRRGIDRLCEDFFLSNRARERDDNLLFVREWLLRGEANLAGRLSLYDRIRNHETVPDDEANPCVTALGLSGITRVENGCLRVRNRIYERVFDHDWVMANMPVLRASGATAIAVLPFVEASGDPQNEYWTDGLTEELINALGRIKGLSVASRTSSFHEKGSTHSLVRFSPL
ncbi:MAG: AAA-like domain-containing protein [Verrucomicrobia bacterium]|nr:AAA-like domain-containing protein [Verrucomicrobiota bacterium]